MRKRESGQIALLFTVAIIPLMAILGLVTDIGYMNYVQKCAQSAADAAALAAVSRFNSTIGGSTFGCDQYDWICNSTPVQCPPSLTTASDPVQSACLYAKQNGFYPTDTTNTTQNVTVVSSVSSTPSTAPGLNSVGWWITVRVTQRVPQLFSAVVGNTSGLVAARSTGVVSPGLGCVYAMDPSAPGTYYQNGSTVFNANCGILVNSSDPSAAMMNSGNATVNATSYSVVGGVNWHGTISPTPTTGITPFPDPLRRLQPPSPCSSSTGCNAADCTAHPNQVVVNGATDLWPGAYCGGIWVKNGTATFHPGNYFIVGGGITTQDSNSHVRGTNTFFYNTYNSSNSYSPVNFNANSDVQLSAPNSGTYAGILFFQDRGCCTSMTTESFQGGATSYFQGTIYFINSLVQFAGNPSVGVDGAKYTIVVARRFSVQGTSSMSNDFSGVDGGNPIKQVGLVE
jgi:Flp pilus assembly protein TadG